MTELRKIPRKEPVLLREIPYETKGKKCKMSIYNCWCVYCGREFESEWGSYPMCRFHFNIWNESSNKMEFWNKKEVHYDEETDTIYKIEEWEEKLKKKPKKRLLKTKKEKQKITEELNKIKGKKRLLKSNYEKELDKQIDNDVGYLIKDIDGDNI